MVDLLEKIKKATEGCEASVRQAIDLDLIKIESGAIQEVASYLVGKSYRQVSIVADSITYQVAGAQLEAMLTSADLCVHTTIIKPNAQGDVIADEPALIQHIIDIQRYTADVVIAVGGGTIHDIARYSSYSTRIPFVSVPTAPSVDGFNSKGAPILIRGDKQTIAAVGPDAIFADLDILVKAPKAMIAAGFADMLGKYTSLFDWKFGSIVGAEPYLQVAADITRTALLQCVNQIDLIALRQEDGIRTLIGALIESGLAMLLLGHSHPASGAEHHLSHYWEMAYIRLGKRQLLHGAKVGVACVQISRLYHQIASEGSEVWRNTAEKESWAPGARIAEHWEELRLEIANIPDPATLSVLLEKIGGPTSIQELSVSEELLESSLREAHQVRLNRFTLLRAYNERLNYQH